MILTTQILEKFRLYLIYSEKSKATVEKYMRDTRSFAEFSKSSELCRQTVLDYKNKLSKKHAASSVNSIIASLNSLLDFLGLSECKVKSIKIQRQIYCPESRELKHEEYTKLVNTAKRQGKERIELILQVIGSTGIRVSELEFITAEAAKEGAATVFCKGKNRCVLITKALQKKLNLYCKKHGIKSGSIFITKTGKPLNRTNIWREMKALCKAAGVSETKVFPHNLRHLFARAFYAVEKDLAKLADILGHSNINTTRIYILTTRHEYRRQLESLRLLI